jgi:prepilin-type processing-associated H-X9-DG protein
MTEQITANNGGSMLIEANALGLGLALTNTTNYLMADGSIDLSAASIEATNSIISAGLSRTGVAHPLCHQGS